MVVYEFDTPITEFLGATGDIIIREIGGNVTPVKEGTVTVTYTDDTPQTTIDLSGYSFSPQNLWNEFFVKDDGSLYNMLEKIKSFNISTDVTSIINTSSINTYGDQVLQASFGSDDPFKLTRLESFGVIDDNGDYVTKDDVDVDSNTPTRYYAENGVLYEKKLEQGTSQSVAGANDQIRYTLICYPRGKIDASFSLPSEINKISYKSFTNAKNLTEIKLTQDQLTTIFGTDATFGTIGSNQFGIPENVTLKNIAPDIDETGKMKVTLNDDTIKYIEVVGDNVSGATFNGNYYSENGTGEDISGSLIEKIEFPVNTDSDYWIWGPSEDRRINKSLTGLKEISFRNDASYNGHTIVDNVMYWEDPGGMYLVLYPAARTDSDGKTETSFTLPEKVNDRDITIIDPGVFLNANKLTEIRLTKGQLSLFDKSAFGEIGENDFGIPENVILVDVNATNVNAGFTVSKTEIEVKEGESDKFTVVLTSKPTSDVVLDISSSNADKVTFDKASLTFTSDNWNTPQEVIVSAVDDKIANGNTTTTNVTISVNTTNTSDTVYSGLANKTVTVNIIEDNDVAGFTVSKETIEVKEGESGKFTVVLTSQPTSDVVLDIASLDTNEVTFDNASLTFT